MTACGFWVVAALSIQMSGFPCTFCLRIGKSFRMTCGFSPPPSSASTCGTGSAGRK